MSDHGADRRSGGTAALTVSGLNAFYGESHVLHDVDLEVHRGELVTLLGNNGAGKTTTLRSIMGLVKRQGSIMLHGEEIVSADPEVIARRGIGYVPEERGIFSTLSVKENLFLPPVVKQGGLPLEDIHRLFPNLRERWRSQGTALSGGEQQMLAIARILRAGADVVLLDEPTEGLAPVIVQQIGAALRELKRKGLTILMVEQNFHFARTIADRHYIVEDGHVVDMIPDSDLAQPSVLAKLNGYLGV